MRARLFCIVATVLAILGLSACSTTQVNVAPPAAPKKSMLELPEFTGSKERDDYRHRLNASAHRFDPKSALVAHNGYLWLKKGWKPGSCSTMCATATKKGSSIEVSLPVGYEVDRYAPKAADIIPITKVNYWGMTLHRAQSVTVNSNQPSAPIPAQAKPETQAPYLAQATGGYIEVRYIKRNRDGRYFLDPTGEIKREPLGKSYGFDDDALITRRADGKGFEVRLPKDYKVMSSDVDHWIPLYLVTFSKSRHLLPSGGMVHPA